jgi:predicted DNA-binding transcriptional regulator YafY
MKEKRITRLLRLFQMLQVGAGKNASELAKACGVGRRTIFRDLQTLRDAGVPLEFNAKAKQYYAKAKSTIQPGNFTADEAIAVIAIATELGRDRWLPFCDAAYQAALKIERSVSKPFQQGVRRAVSAIKIRPTRPAYLKGKADVYEQLIAAVVRRHAVKIEYESLTEWECITTGLRPYQLLFSQHSWYIIGRSSLHREIRIFNLARIKSLETLKQKFVVPRSFDLDRHLGNAWHFMNSSDRDSHVVIHFKPLVARNVAEVNWHKTQRTKFLPDGSMVFHATVAGLSEIAWWILGYGDQAEVLRPARLRQLIAQRAKNMAAMYNGAGEIKDERSGMRDKG